MKKLRFDGKNLLIAIPLLVVIAFLGEFFLDPKSPYINIFYVGSGVITAFLFPYLKFVEEDDASKG